MINKKIHHQVVGNAGLYYVCYRLSLLGWNTMPTSRNAKGVDVIIYSHDAKKKLAIEIKTLSKRSPVPLGISLERLTGDFFVICRKITDIEPECFVLKPEEVVKLAHRSEKDGKVSYWLQPKSYEKYEGQWERIGRGD